MTYININSEERRPVFLLFIMFFSTVAASITGSAVRDAVFLIQFDRSFLPIMYILIAIVMAGVITVYKKLTSSQDQVTLITISGLLFSVSLLFFQSNLSGWMIPVFYVWMEIITVLSILQFWLLAGEVFNPRQAKRIFSLVIAGGSFAGMGTGYGIKPFVAVYGSEHLLYMTIFFIGLSVVMGQLVRPFRIGRQGEMDQSDMLVNKQKIKFDPYLKAIALMVACSAFISKIVDYQFKIMAATAFPTQDELVNFFGTYYMSTGAATLIMQIFVTGFILTRFGILAGLLVLPLTLAVGSAGFFMAGTLLAVFIAKFSDQVFKFSINNAVQEILWLPFSPQKKRQSKPIIDGTIRSGLEGLAGLMIFALVSLKLIPESKIYLLSLIVILGVALWLWNCFRLKDGYVNSLMASIENRQLNLDHVEFDINDAHIVNTLDVTLRDKNEFKQLFALDLLWTLPLEPWKHTIRTLFSTGSLAVKRGVLELAWRQPDILPDQLIIENIHSKDELTPFTISCAGDRCIYKQVGILPQYLESTSNAIRSSSAVAILKQEPDDKEARAALDLILDEGSENNIVETLGFMKGLIGFMSQNQFLRFLSHKSDNIKNASLSLIEKNPDNSYLNSVIQSLAKASTFSQAEKALLSFPEKTSLVQLDFRLNDPTSSTELRAGILKVFHHYHRTDAINIIISIMDDPELLILDEASNALVNLSKNTTLVKSDLETIDAKIYTLAKRAYQLYQFRRHIKDDPDALLLLDHIESDLGMLIPILLKLGTLKDPDIPIETYIRYVESNDPELLPIVLELIESTFSAENRTVSLPLIDPESDPIKAGQELFPDMINSAEQMLIFWTENHHYWKTGIAIHYLLKKENTAVLKKIIWSKIPSTIFTAQLYRQSEQDYLNRNFLKESFSNQENKTMYSILEKTIILKSVDLFNAIPGDVLTKIAQIAEEIRTGAKYKIFREGDHGDSMFVIISGKVNVAQNGQSIAVLEQGKCIGEMALLDQEPRSADAITLEESVLLKIDQEGFYELMASNPEIMKQIVKILTRRVREMNKKLTDART